MLSFKLQYLSWCLCVST